MAGRPTPGFDTNTTLALATSHMLKGKWGMLDKACGHTALNQATPGYVSNLTGPTYSLWPRMVLDSAVDIGRTTGAPRARLLSALLTH